MSDRQFRYPGIEGRTAVVTGGSHGIGTAVSRALARHGASVVVNGRDKDALNQVVEQIRADGGTAEAVIADVTDPEAVTQLREQTERVYGPADLLAVIAGAGARPIALADLTPQAWHESIDTNLTSAFLTLREFLPGMQERGRGAVVTMSSSSGRLPFRTSPAYAAAKAGLLMLTREAAGQAAGSGVRVNAVSPATTMNDKIRARMPAPMLEKVSAGFPLGRIGAPEDSADAVLFLLSEAASWITGTTLDVAGGQVMI